MKKSIKLLITCSVAAIGVGASVGGAYALYRANETDPTVFTIGTYTHTTEGSINYIVGAAQLGSSNAVIDPAHNEIYYNFPLGGSYSYDSEELAAAQDIIYGNVKVDITCDSSFYSEQESGLHVEWYAFIDGYSSNSFWNNWENNVRRITPAVDPVISADSTSLNSDVAVRAVANPTIPEPVEDPVTHVISYANQWVRVGFKFKNLTDAHFLEIAGKSFEVKVTFAGLSESAEAPYIGTDTNGYAADADTQLGFRMTPNIDAEVWQWKYQGLTGANDMLIIYEKDTTKYYIKDSTTHDNVLIDDEEVYSVYYYGGIPSSGVDNYVLTTNTDTHIIYDITE